jgi:hypothetical protein
LSATAAAGETHFFATLPNLAEEQYPSTTEAKLAGRNIPSQATPRCWLYQRQPSAGTDNSEYSGTRNIPRYSVNGISRVWAYNPELWDDYIAAYEDAIRETSTKHAPWFIIPANNKWFRNLAVAKIVVETLESLGMQFPEPTVNPNHGAEL